MAGNHRTWKNRLLLILCLCFLVPVVGTWAQLGSNPQSAFLFPRFVSSGYESATIAIFNPSAREASAVLSLTGSDGSSLGLTSTVTIPPLGQISMTATELFGPVSLDAALSVTSATRGSLPTVRHSIPAALSSMESTRPRRIQA